jgi:hypothetical protein
LPLIAGLQFESCVTNDLALRLFPGITPASFQSSLEQALDRFIHEDVETSWADSLVSGAGDDRPVALTVTEGMHIERRQRIVQADPMDAYKACTSLGGERGWLYLDWTWQVRGWIDKLVGGVGLRRGRRHPSELRVGDSLDFWRVEALEPGRLMRLRAEMKVPGKAWLEYQSIPEGQGSTRLVQTAYFAPHGLAGFLYWYLLYPIHGFIFSGMIRNVASLAMNMAGK